MDPFRATRFSKTKALLLRSGFFFKRGNEPYGSFPRYFVVPRAGCFFLLSQGFRYSSRSSNPS